MLKTQFRLEKQKLLLVEGMDESYFFAAILELLDKRKEVQIYAYNGKDKLDDELFAIALMPGFSLLETVAVVRDADEDPGASFNSTIRSLHRAQLYSPARPEQYAGANPRVGVFITPGNSRKGSLETLCIEELADYSIHECIHKFLDCVAATRPDQPIRNKAKAIVQSFIATAPDSHVRLLGEAARSGCFNLEHKSYQGITNFLKGL
jgi:hypothetical protein